MKKTPMQMRKKEVKSDAPKQIDKPKGRPKSAMERYAQERNAQMKAQQVRPITVDMIHDPESDMHTLTRAAEIKMSPGRHRAAKGAAKKRVKALMKVTTA